MRNLLEKRGGSLGKSNSVMWKFDRKGLLSISKEDVEEEELFEEAIEAGAENIEEAGESFDVEVPAESFDQVRGALQSFLEKKRGIGEEKKWGETEDDRPIFERSELIHKPQNPVVIADKETAKAALNFLEDLEDHEDVQNLFSDLDVPEEIIDSLAAED